MPKHDSYGPPQHAQPLLRGINLAKFLCESCPFQRMKSRAIDFIESAETGGVVRSAPSDVPPPSNTGVHHETENRGAASGELCE